MSGSSGIAAAPSRGLLYLLTIVRSVVGEALMVPHTLVFSLLCVLCATLGWNQFATRLMHVWGRGILWMFGIKIEVKGEENLPMVGGAIAIFNHQSHFDIPAMLASTYKPIRFGAKAELFRIPAFGSAMRAVGTLMIVRDNRALVMQTYKEAAVKFAKGFIFVLAPEGTRQTEPKIGRFKKGPFIFAIDANVPLVPVIITGAHMVLRKNSLAVNLGQKSRTIRLEYLPPISTSNCRLEELESFVEQVHVTMKSAYERNLSQHPIC